MPIRRRLRTLIGTDGVNSVRRQMSMRVDQLWALLTHVLRSRPRPLTAHSDARFALICVNYSTTEYLKLLLLTLCDQDELNRVKQIIVVDNGSRDGGLGFLRQLDERIGAFTLVEHRHFLSHARGMRAGARQVTSSLSSGAPTVMIFSDADVIFMRTDTLQAIAARFDNTDTALLGEVRFLRSRRPDIQASFFAIRRAVYDRRDILPLVHHGSPANWQQRSIWRAGLTVADFQSNQAGWILHRGRSGVAAAARYRPRSQHATATQRSPHFMGVPGGADVWARTEGRFQHLLAPSAESLLVEHLCMGLRRLNTDDT